MRLAKLVTIALTIAGCAAPVVSRESRVAVRQRQGSDDAALVVIYQSDVCKLTIRDRSGQLHDSVLRGERYEPIAMTRDLPNGVWRIQTSGRRSTLLSALALPPGRYEIVRYASADWRPLDVDSGPALGKTDCDGALDWHAARLRFRVDAGKLTLLALPKGPVTFDDLNAMLPAPNDPLVYRTSSSWFPAIKQARKDVKAELAVRRRQPRAGYEFYPDCDGKTAIVRTSGTPFDWYSDPNDDAKREEFRHRARVPIRSVHATGFGAGCVRGLAFVLFLSDAAEVDAATSAVGEWLEREDLAGEVDLVVSPIPVSF